MRALARLRRKRLIDVVDYVATAPAAWRLARRVDAAGLAALRRDYATAAPDPGYSKYLDVRYWVHSKLLRVRRMGLQGGPPLRLLDLGMGPGFFSFAARAYGHRAEGVDMPGTPFYDGMTALLGVTRHLWTIRAFEAMPRWGVFDRVTAFQICFDQGPDGPWGAAEWAFFLDDAMGLLAPGGRLLLEFNEAPSAEVSALLARRGAPLHGLRSESVRR